MLGYRRDSWPASLHLYAILIMFSRISLRINKLAGHRWICFDEKFARNVLSRVDKGHERHTNKDGSRVRSSWNRDFLHPGATLKIPTVNGEFSEVTVLCRTSNYSVVIQDVLSKQILTVKASNLPIYEGFVERTEKKKVVDTLLDLFDSSKVSMIEIRRPFQDNGPMVFHADQQEIFQDSARPYLVISYFNSPICLAFPCTSEMWGPQRSPLTMLVADSTRCGAPALWDRNLLQATAVDLTRMASLPAECLDTHFQRPDSTATDVRAVMAAIMQTVMDATVLSGEGSDSEQSFDELDMGYYEDEIESTLVIGHYEVDERTNLPLDPALQLPVEEGPPA